MYVKHKFYFMVWSEEPIKGKEPIKGSRSWGRQLKSWKDGLRESLEELGLKEQDAQDRQKWRRGIVATDPQLGDKVWAKKKKIALS